MRLYTTLFTTAASVLVAAAVLAGSLGVFVRPIHAEDPQLSMRPVFAGSYENLSVWKKIQLTTAAYVRPELYKRAEVAYAYDAESIKQAMSPQLVEKLKEGELWFGVQQEGQPLTVPTPTYEQAMLIKDIAGGGNFAPEKLAAWLALENRKAMEAGGELKIISSSDALGGLQPDSEYIAWNPGKAISSGQGNAAGASSATGAGATTVAPNDGEPAKAD